MSIGSGRAQPEAITYVRDASLARCHHDEWIKGLTTGLSRGDNKKVVVSTGGWGILQVGGGLTCMLSLAK